MFRFSSFVCVTSVHIRVSSVLRLVVHSGERILEDGRAVRVTNAGDYGQDIDVDLRGMLRCASRGNWRDKISL